jgi:hypothetical protein
MIKSETVERVYCDLCESQITEQNAPDGEDRVEVCGHTVLVQVLVRHSPADDPLDLCRGCTEQATRFLGRH